MHPRFQVTFPILDEDLPVRALFAMAAARYHHDAREAGWHPVGPPGVFITLGEVTAYGPVTPLDGVSWHARAQHKARKNRAQRKDK